MVSTHWILLMTLIFSDNSYQTHKMTTYGKEYCIQHAHLKWAEFYANKTPATFGTVCVNDKNSHDFVEVKCDKMGNCNI